MYLINFMSRENFKVLYFFIDGSGPDMVQARYLDEFAQLAPDIPVVRVNAEKETELVNKYQVETTPIFVFVEKEMEITRADGVYSSENLKELIQNQVYPLMSR